jgi:hypothetical protein
LDYSQERLRDSVESSLSSLKITQDEIEINKIMDIKRIKLIKSFIIQVLGIQDTDKRLKAFQKIITTNYTELASMIREYELEDIALLIDPLIANYPFESFQIFKPYIINVK